MILFLIDDGVSLEMALGGFKAGLELPILLFLGHCNLSIYYLPFPCLCSRFLESGFYM